MAGAPHHPNSDYGQRATAPSKPQTLHSYRLQELGSRPPAQGVESVGHSRQSGQASMFPSGEATGTRGIRHAEARGQPAEGYPGAFGTGVRLFSGKGLRRPAAQRTDQDRPACASSAALVAYPRTHLLLRADGHDRKARRSSRRMQQVYKRALAHRKKRRRTRCLEASKGPAGALSDGCPAPSKDQRSLGWGRKSAQATQRATGVPAALPLLVSS